MEKFTKYLLSFASTQLLPVNTLSFFLFFYQNNWMWKVNGNLQFREYPSLQCTKTSQRESLCYLTRNSQSRQISTIWNLVFTLLLHIVLKPWTLSIKKDLNTARAVSQLKFPVERITLRFILQLSTLVMWFLVRTWDPFLEVMLATELEWYWTEEALTNRNWLKTLFASTLSWYTRTWLSTKPLVTRKPLCCVPFFLLRNSRQETS